MVRLIWARQWLKYAKWGDELMKAGNRKVGLGALEFGVHAEYRQIH